MENSDKKERLNLYIGKDLARRLKFCSDKYGVARNQLAVMLIGQGVSGIEAAFNLSEQITSKSISDIVNLDEENKE